MPTNSFQTVPASITARALTNSFSSEDQGRREEMRLNKDFYYGKQEQQLKLLNDDQDPLTVNLIKPVAKKLSTMLYSQKLVREFEGPASSIAALEAVYDENSIDALLLSVDKNAELTGSCLVSPIVDETKETGIRLQQFDAANISVIHMEDVPDTAEAVSLISLVDRIRDERNMTVERVIKQQIWTKDEIIYYEGEIELGREENEFGFLPFVNFKGEEVYDQYLGHSPSTGTRKLNESYNQLLTDLGFMIKMQSFTPIALSGFSNGETVSIHPGRALSIPAGASAEAIGLNPKIEEVLTTIAGIEDKIYETSSVPKVSVVGGGDAKSGKELLIRWFPLMKVFQEKTVRYEKYELQLANLILDVLNLPRIDSVQVHYTESHIMPFNSEDDTLMEDIALNIKTPVDELMRRDPTLSEDEAQAEVLINTLINKQLKESSMPGEEFEEEEEEEEI